MKKVLLLSAFVSALILGTSATAVHAETTTSTTTGDITFTLPTDTVDPWNPNLPGEVNKPDPENPATGLAGPLTLDTAPILSFGTHEMEMSAKTYTAVNLNPYLQVSDRRGVSSDGQSQGWNLKVAITDFKDTGKKLNGATMSLTKASVKSHLAGQGAAPTASDITSLDSTDQATTIFTADKGQGLGSWLEVYPRNVISLTVPQARLGEYSATLTWTLSSEPLA
ncbi:WxL domain-containing protein [Lapidilactobacillus mulanensis]|uniref:WxL domain-containing protein n=1 Tax=Lapidilactobacillus mulanensis TaxID=2485999 RepID=A0ABW4DME7_9LACO|nr:WxL domain-containing protein [Lapidilactobacillus mulanensis]